MIVGLVTALLALAAVVAIAWPLVSGRAASITETDPERVELEERLAASLRAIREIEFDHRAGNLSDDDYAELDRAERAVAARLIHERDQDPAGS